MDGTLASRERWTLGAESAQLAAWIALALLNQGLIAFLLPPASARTRAVDPSQIAG